MLSSDQGNSNRSIQSIPTIRILGRTQLWFGCILYFYATVLTFLSSISKEWIVTISVITNNSCPQCASWRAVQDKDEYQRILLAFATVSGAIGYLLLGVRWWPRFAQHGWLKILSVLFLIIMIVLDFTGYASYNSAYFGTTVQPNPDLFFGTGYDFSEIGGVYGCIAFGLLIWHEIAEFQVRRKMRRRREKRREARREEPNVSTIPIEERLSRGSVRSSSTSRIGVDNHIMDSIRLKYLSKDQLSPIQRRLVLSTNCFSLLLYCGGMVISTLEEGWALQDGVNYILSAWCTLGYGLYTPITTGGRIFMYIYWPIGFFLISSSSATLWNVALFKLDRRLKQWSEILSNKTQQARQNKHNNNNEDMKDEEMKSPSRHIESIVEEDEDHPKERSAIRLRDIVFDIDGDGDATEKDKIKQNYNNVNPALLTNINNLTITKTDTTKTNDPHRVSHNTSTHTDSISININTPAKNPSHSGMRMGAQSPSPPSSRANPHQIHNLDKTNQSLLSPTAIAIASDSNSPIIIESHQHTYGGPSSSSRSRRPSGAAATEMVRFSQTPQTPKNDLLSNISVQGHRRHPAHHHHHRTPLGPSALSAGRFRMSESLTDLQKVRVGLVVAQGSIVNPISPSKTAVLPSISNLSNPPNESDSNAGGAGDDDIRFYLHKDLMFQNQYTLPSNYTREDFMQYLRQQTNLFKSLQEQKDKERGQQEPPHIQPPTPPRAIPSLPPLSAAFVPPSTAELRRNNTENHDEVPSSTSIAASTSRAIPVPSLRSSSSSSSSSPLRDYIIPLAIKLAIAILSVISWMCLIGGIFVWSEDYVYNYWECQWSTFNLLTTISVGSIATPFSTTTSAVFVWYLLFGVGALAYCFTLMAEIAIMTVDPTFRRRKNLTSPNGTTKVKVKASNKSIKAPNTDEEETNDENFLQRASELDDFILQLIEQHPEAAKTASAAAATSTSTRRNLSPPTSIKLSSTSPSPMSPSLAGEMNVLSNISSLNKNRNPRLVITGTVGGNQIDVPLKGVSLLLRYHLAFKNFAQSQQQRMIQQQRKMRQKEKERRMRRRQSRQEKIKLKKERREQNSTEGSNSPSTAQQGKVSFAPSSSSSSPNHMGMKAHDTHTINAALSEGQHRINGGVLISDPSEKNGSGPGDPAAAAAGAAEDRVDHRNSDDDSDISLSSESDDWKQFDWSNTREWIEEAEEEGEGVSVIVPP